jgi:hypothetical protein
MKTLLITCLLALTVSVAKSQELSNTTDPITGKKSKIALTMLSGEVISLECTFVELTSDENGSYLVYQQSVRSGVNGAFNSFDIKTMSLIFKMDDGQIIKFSPNLNTSGIRNISNTSILKLACPITNDELIVLAKHAISIFRLGLKEDNSGIDEYGFNDLKQLQIRKSALFMLGQINN